MACNAHYQNTFVYIKLIYFHNRCHRAFQIFESRFAFRANKCLIFLLSSGRNGAKDSASAGIYLGKLWIDLKKFLNCNSLRGIFSVLIGFVYRINRVTPVAPSIFRGSPIVKNDIGGPLSIQTRALFPLIKIGSFAPATRIRCSFSI